MTHVVATWSSVLNDDPTEIREKHFNTVQEAWLNMPLDLKDEFVLNRKNCHFFFDYDLYVFTWACLQPTMLYIVHGMPHLMGEKSCG